MRRLPSPSTALSFVALGVALSGTAYAAIDLARNSVGPRQLRAGSVGTSELKRGAVRSVDVRDRSLRARDFARGQLRAGAQGAPGPAGAAGPAGPAGPEGPPGVVATASHSTSQDMGVCCNMTVLSDPLETAITTQVPARLIATATIRIKGNNMQATETVCKLTLDEPPPATATGPAFGQEMAAVLPASYAGGVSLAATGRTGVLAAGTHWVALHCLPGTGTGNRTVDSGDLTVVAVREG